MKSFIKLLVAVVGLLIFLVVVVAVIVVVMFDPNDYRDEIAAIVEKDTGRQLTIDGDLTLKLVPCCGIGIGRSNLSNPPGFEQTKFASVDEVRLGLRLLPLLMQRQLEIGEVQLSGLDLNLQRLANGRANWEFPRDEAIAEGAATDAEKAGDETALALSVASIAIEDARVAFADARAGQDFLVENVNLKTGEIEPGKPFDLTATLRAADRTSGTVADISLESRAAVDTRAMTANVQNVQGLLTVAGDAVPGRDANAELTIEGLDYAPGMIGINGLTANIRAAGVTVRVDGGGTLQDRGDGLAGNFTLEPLSPRELLQTLGSAAPSTADPQVLTRLEASGKWQAAGDSYQLSDLTLQLDDTQISGSAGIRNLASPRFRVALTGDQLNVDRYLPPETDGAAVEEVSAAAAEEADLATEQLRQLVLDGSLKLGEVIVAGARLQQLRADVTARNGVITLDPMSAQLYDGSYNGRIQLDVTGNQPRIDLDQTLDAVQIGGLLTDMLDVEQLKGLVKADIKLNGTGLTQAELTRSLAGTLSFDLADSLYDGMDIWYEIRRVRARIKRDPVPEREGPAQTQITALAFGGVIADGVMRSERMSGEIPYLKLSGNGTLNLIEQALDYRLNARVFKTPQFGAESLDDLTNLTIPLTIGGTIESPRIGVDLEDLLKSVAGQQIRKKILEELGIGGDEEQAPDGEAAPEDDQPRPEDILLRGILDAIGD
ncbi:MAG: AsmA family protein [Gammaproteobacteria bacterium]|nr:AsmA family protein [Gammaproteobacteria bacterium]